MAQNPDYVYQNLFEIQQGFQYPDEFIDWGGRRDLGNVMGVGQGCILGKNAVYLGCNIVSGDNSIAIGNDLRVDKDTIVIGTSNHRKVIIGGVDILDKLDKLDRLEKMVDALWDAPGMPGSNLVTKEFLGGD